MNPTCPLCQTQHVQERYALRQAKNHAVWQCQKCSLQFLHPQPSDRELRAFYTEAYYRTWGFDGQENRIVERMKCKTFERRLQLISKFKQEGKILDVGCATGFFLRVANKFGFTSYGIELSEFSGNLARKKFGEETIHIGKIEDCQFPAQSFDIVTMSDFLEHIKNPEVIFRKTAILLKEDGIVVIATPDTDSFTCKFMRARWTHYKQEHLFYFNQNTIEKLALQTGFEVIAHRLCDKAINLFYLFFQFRTYPHWIFTPLSHMVYSFFPMKMLSYNVCVPMGERVFILQKRKREIGR